MDIRELTGAETELLTQQLVDAHETGKPVRVVWDGGLKVKVAEGTWTPPLGSPPEPDAHEALVELREALLAGTGHSIWAGREAGRIVLRLRPAQAWALSEALHREQS